MGLLDKVKAGAEQAASSAKRQAQLVETKRELNQAYSELGKIAFGLVGRDPAAQLGPSPRDFEGHVLLSLGILA